MKKILSILTLALAAAAVHAADVDATITLPNAAGTIRSGGTNKVTALTTNSYFTIGVPENEKVSIFVDFAYLNAPGAGDVNGLDLQLFRGIDSTTFESNIWQTIRFQAGASTAKGSTCTNITVDGIPYLRGRFANVSTNSHATNLLVKVKAKTPAYKSR